ncbi:MAG: quinone-dependent dihydroorotate dehydrogenase [Chloroflexi bacterium]|nr:quinone-dependent dihydroorotate dehydrogenase [Chloroflexota bacterium]
MYGLIRRLLFRLDAEDAHQKTLRALALAGRLAVVRAALSAACGYHDARLETELLGLTFTNPVGIAAGYDKNGAAVTGLGALGFGHVEVGTVTRIPQPGNPRPRIHRVSESRAVINSMGFPNDGVDALLESLGREPLANHTTRLGINIGKGKDTPLERAADDYGALLERVHAYADYVAVNVSSPNTMGLRQLQARDMLEHLLMAIAGVRDQLPRRVPLLVKIAPDLREGEIDDVLAAITASGFDGIIATNTTISRDGIAARYADLRGGLSGAPLCARALAVTRHIARATHGQLPLIGAGGIVSPADAIERIRAGAWLVQVYTGLVYAGPSLPRQICRALVAACKQAGVSHVAELRGTTAV